MILEQSLVIARYGQYGAHGVATGIIEFATYKGWEDCLDIR